MRAAWVSGGPPGLVELPPPRAGAGWAVIEVIHAGVCGTDLALAAGMYGFEGVPGHEFVGRVVGGPRALLGRRVVADINVGCGRCARCRGGGRKHCVRRRVLGIRGLDGALAERVRVPVRNLHRVPRGVDDDAAVFAEPLAAALEAWARVPLPRDRRVLVVGPGRLGQLLTRVALHAGARTSCLGRGAAALARLPGGVARESALPSAWRRGFGVVFDCSGTAAGTRAALDAVRPGGAVVVKSTHGAPAPIDVDRIVVDEIRVLGSRCGDVARALAWLSRGHVDPRPLISARYRLTDVAAAFAASARPEQLKVLVAP